MRLLVVTLWMCLVATVAVAQTNYLIRPGDSLQVEVLEDPSLNRTVVVLPDGRFSFPFAGTIRAGGRTLTQVERGLTAAIASNFAVDPNVFVSIARLREVVPQAQIEAEAAPEAEPTMSVFFIGEIASPGEKSLSLGTTFLQSLASSGGFTNFAAQKRIQVRRTNPTTQAQQRLVVNYKDLARGRGEAVDFPLQEGDVILVPERRLFE